jgi:hypothetical protein
MPRPPHSGRGGNYGHFRPTGWAESASWRGGHFGAAAMEAVRRASRAARCHSPGRSPAGCSDTGCGPGRSRPRRRRLGRSAVPWLRQETAGCLGRGSCARAQRCGTARPDTPGRGGAGRGCPGTQAASWHHPSPRVPPLGSLRPAPSLARSDTCAQASVSPARGQSRSRSGAAPRQLKGDTKALLTCGSSSGHRRVNPISRLSSSCCGSREILVKPYPLILVCGIV